VNRRIVLLERVLWLRVEWLALLALLVMSNNMRGTTLTPETAAAWEAYVKGAQTRLHNSLEAGHAFLSMEEVGAAEAIRSGEPLVIPAGRTPQKVSAGLIHDWIGIILIPNVSLQDVLFTVRDYAHYADFYRPAVVASKELNHDRSQDRFSMLLANRSLFATTVLDGDYESSYVRVDNRRWYSTSEARRIQEIENYGTPGQQILPEGAGTGLIWRMFSITRFEERASGVYIELEVIALSRDIPSSLRWVAAPIVRHVARHALLTSLEQTREAVRSPQLMALRLSENEKHATAKGTGIGAAAKSASFR